MRTAITHRPELKELCILRGTFPGPEYWLVLSRSPLIPYGITERDFSTFQEASDFASKLLEQRELLR